MGEQLARVGRGADALCKPPNARAIERLVQEISPDLELNGWVIGREQSLDDWELGILWGHHVAHDSSTGSVLRQLQLSLSHVLW